MIIDKKCINCNYFTEEAFGNTNFDLENGMVCSCVDSEYFENHVTPQNGCGKWVEQHD